MCSFPKNPTQIDVRFLFPLRIFHVVHVPMFFSVGLPALFKIFAFIQLLSAKSILY